MNGCTRLRFEFIVHNHHHTPAFESRVVTVPATVPYVSHQDGSQVGSKLAWPLSTFQAKTALRFEFIVHNHHHAPAFESRVVKVPAPVPYVSHQEGAFLN
eukprot:scaffold48727_cov38-Cyclotella_meneghiniana.AAC.1